MNKNKRKITKKERFVKGLGRTFAENLQDIEQSRPIEAFSKHDIKKAKSMIYGFLDAVTGDKYYPIFTFEAEDGSFKYTRTTTRGIDLNWLVQKRYAPETGIGAYAKDGMIGTVYNDKLYETILQEMKDLGFRNPAKLLEPGTKYKIRREFKIKQ